MGQLGQYGHHTLRHISSFCLESTVGPWSQLFQTIVGLKGQLRQSCDPGTDTVHLQILLTMLIIDILSTDSLSVIDWKYTRFLKIF